MELPLDIIGIEIGSIVTQALSTLLNEKHLYQHVLVPVDEYLSQLGEREGQTAAGREWTAASEGRDFGPFVFQMPLLRAHCPECEQVLPFNPAGPAHTYNFSNTYQVFALPFQCQGCKGMPVVFVVTRDGNKLTLSGRSVIESMLVPDYMPKTQRKYYSGAKLAFNSNQILPALFLLRTLVEQYMLSVVPGDYKAGEDLCAAYHAVLDEDFRARFPSFADIYAKLSDALHGAREDADLFESEIERIESHFDGKRTYERAAKAAARAKQG